MVVRRTQGKKIRIVHEGTKEVLELVVLQVYKHGQGGTRLHLQLEYPHDAFKIEWATDYELGPADGELVLHRGSEFGILHKSGDKMEIQVADISYNDANIRLVDKARLFRFDWSERALATAG